jgi:excisionase family DNA binding protein
MNRRSEYVPRNSSTHRPKPLLSVEETAILLGEARSTLYRAVKAGTLPLPMFRIGARIRIPRVAVERLIDGMAPLVAVRGDRLEGDDGAAINQQP